VTEVHDAGNNTNQSANVAFFASHAFGGFGIADGLGDSNECAESMLYSHVLLEETYRELSKRALAMRKPDLSGALRLAHEAAIKTRHSGSAAVLLGVLHQDMLNILVLGNCGILVMRPWELQPVFFGGILERTMRPVYRYVPMPGHVSPLLSSQDNVGPMVVGSDLLSLQLRRGDILLAGCRKLFECFSQEELLAMAIEHRARGSAASAVIAGGMATEIENRAASPGRAGDMLGGSVVLVAEAVAWTPVASSKVLQNFSGKGR